MSTLDDGPTRFDPDEDDADEWIEDNREYLEREADSDAPHAWVAQRLLDSVEESASASNDDESFDGGAS